MEEVNECKYRYLFIYASLIYAILLICDLKRERKKKYRECKTKLKQAIKESKKRVDEDFGKWLSEKYKEDRKSYWREVKNESNADTDNTSLSKISEVLDENGKVLKDGAAVKERWREYLKNLMNVKNGGPAKVTAAVLNGGGGGVYREETIKYEEVNQAIKRLKKMERQQELMELQQKC